VKCVGDGEFILKQLCMMSLLSGICCTATKLSWCSV